MTTNLPMQDPALDRRVLLSIAILGACAGTPAAPAPLRDDVMFTDHAHAMPLGGASSTRAGLASATGDLRYFGGRIIANARVTQVLYGPGQYLPELTATTGATMASAYTQWLTSGVLDWLSEYGTAAQAIGRGAFAGAVQIAPAAARNTAQISDASIQGELAEQILRGALPAPDNDQVYLVSFPAGRTIVAPDGSLSCVTDGFCAYHGTFKLGSQNVYYGVLPDLTTGCAVGCGEGTAFQQQQAVASHALVATITDPEVGLATVVGPPLAWHDTAAGELGDACLGQQATFAGSDGNRYTIHHELSLQRHACVGGPTSAPSPPPSDDVVDLNHDGRADLCGRSSAGVLCALSTGTGFAPASLWDTSFSDQNQFGAGPQYYSTLGFPDLNHDGLADVCARGRAGVYCEVNTGSGFGPITLWSADFDDAHDWNAGPQYWATIQYPDVNHDGRADLCGRGRAGVFCALNTGAGFAPATLWETTFSDANQFNLGPEFYTTLRFPDLNHDGLADVCGRGRAGVYCALSTGTGFGPTSLWTTDFDDAHAWSAGPQYYATIQFPDVNHDGNADICGRGKAGVYCALSTGASFAPATLWESFFSDADQFDQGPEAYATLRFPDLDNDGRADLCGRSRSGVFCELNTGTSFGPARLWTDFFGDANGWNLDPSSYATIRFPDLDHDGRADICGRDKTGMTCALNTGDRFAPVTLWSAAYDDAHQWNLGPQYYSTLHFP